MTRNVLKIYRKIRSIQIFAHNLRQLERELGIRVLFEDAFFFTFYYNSLPFSFLTHYNIKSILLRSEYCITNAAFDISFSYFNWQIKEDMLRRYQISTYNLSACDLPINLEWSKFSYFDTSADSLNVQNEFGSLAVKGNIIGTADMELLSPLISKAVPETKKRKNKTINKIIPAK